MGTLLLLVGVAPLYLATVVTGARINVDAEAAALPAWRLATDGSQDLLGVDTTERPHLAEALERNPWISASRDGGAYTNRPPGLWLLAVPAYLVAGTDDYSAGPATATALITTLAALAALHLALRRVVPPWWALLGALVGALGTSAWPIASAQLWPHGPGILLLALAVLALSGDRAATGGLAMGAEVLVRPVAVIAPIAISGTLAARRQFARAAAIAGPAGAALAAIVVYNGVVFGRYSLTGGYQSLFRENLTGQSPQDYLGNLILFLVSPYHGVLVWSPVVATALLGVRRGWTLAPPWARHAAIGGVAYLVVHARLNRVSGGLAFDYRYQLESLMLAAPLLLISAQTLSDNHPRGRHLLVGAAITSVALQGLVAFTLECTSGTTGTAATCTLG